MKLTLLGTKGGPSLSVDRGSPAQVITVRDRPVLIDCGEGVAHQLLRAGIPLADVEKILITHHHSDHNAGYGGLLMSAWASGLSNRLDVFGPPPLISNTKAFFEMNAYDLNLRVKDEGRIPLNDLLFAEEITGNCVVYEDNDMRITASLVDHPPIDYAFGYRIDADDASIVISGDTAPSDGLVELAKDADILVHEVMAEWLIYERVAPLVPNSNWELMRGHLLRSHTSATDIGKVAAAARVKTLVLSHFVPADVDIEDDVWLEPIRKDFGGDIVLGRDLMQLEVQSDKGTSASIGERYR